MTTPGPDQEFAPLDIKCTSVDCANDRHCFLRGKKKAPQFNPPGSCQACWAERVDWSRVHERNLADVEHTFAMMQFEYVRHDNWHKAFDQKAVNRALRKGRKGLRAEAEKVVRKSVGPARPFRDGFQTPWSGNVVHYAQHAVACCCRRCVEEWHAIPVGRALTDDEIRYLTELVCLYIDRRLPELTETGVRVPPIRKPAKPKE